MQRLIDILKDPVWWFSAFFIAIIASVLAAYLKDWLSLSFSAFSRRYRHHRYVRLRKSVRTIQNIERDDAYFVFFGVRQLTGLLLWGISVLAYMISLQQPQMNSWISLFNRSVMLAFQVFFYYRFFTSSMEFRRGLKRYKRRKGLFDVNRIKS